MATIVMGYYILLSLLLYVFVYFVSPSHAEPFAGCVLGHLFGMFIGSIIMVGFFFPRMGKKEDEKWFKEYSPKVSTGIIVLISMTLTVMAVLQMRDITDPDTYTSYGFYSGIISISLMLIPSYYRFRFMQRRSKGKPLSKTENKVGE